MNTPKNTTTTADAQPEKSQREYHGQGPHSWRVRAMLEQKSESTVLPITDTDIIQSGGNYYVAVRGFVYTLRAFGLKSEAREYVEHIRLGVNNHTSFAQEYGWTPVAKFQPAQAKAQHSPADTLRAIIGSVLSIDADDNRTPIRLQMREDAYNAIAELERVKAERDELLAVLKVAARNIESELLKCPESCYVNLSSALIALGRAIRNSAERGSE